MPELSLSQLKEFVSYDPDTGVFTVLKRRGSGKPSGSVIGSKTKKGYLEVRIFGSHYMLHQLAFFYAYGYIPEEVDHINHNKADNRISNLRESYRQDNSKNMPLRKDNTSGRVGVNWDKQTNKWRAEVTVNGSGIKLGRFSDINDAIAARVAAEIMYGFHHNHGAHP
jgi:hypothetical protein